MSVLTTCVLPAICKLCLLIKTPVNYVSINNLRLPDDFDMLILFMHMHTSALGSTYELRALIIACLMVPTFG